MSMSKAAILVLIFMIIVLATLLSLDIDTTDCEKYDAANIPQDMNPCWGGVRK